MMTIKKGDRLPLKYDKISVTTLDSMSLCYDCEVSVEGVHYFESILLPHSVICNVPIKYTYIEPNLQISQMQNESTGVIEQGNILLSGIPQIALLDKSFKETGEILFIPSSIYYAEEEDTYLELVTKRKYVKKSITKSCIRILEASIGKEFEYLSFEISSIEVRQGGKISYTDSLNIDEEKLHKILNGRIKVTLEVKAPRSIFYLDLLHFKIENYD